MIHRPGLHHVNAENLQSDFFTSSVERWRDDLTCEQVDWIERASWDLMSAFDYRKHLARSRGVVVPFLSKTTLRLRQWLRR